jgi:hypothetical protein
MPHGASAGITNAENGPNQLSNFLWGASRTVSSTPLTTTVWETLQLLWLQTSWLVLTVPP